MACTTFTNVFLRPKSVLMSIFTYLRHVKPKTMSLDSPGRRNLNRGSCHTLILDLKILVQTSFCFWSLLIHCVHFTTFTVPQTHVLLLLSPTFLHSKSSKVFSCITSFQKGFLKPLHIFLRFIPNFLHKIIQKGILVISYKGTHFSPYNSSLSLFNWSA